MLSMYVFYPQSIIAVFVLQDTAEFLTTMGGYTANVTGRMACPKFKPQVKVTDLPDHVDWRNLGYVSDVIEQVTQMIQIQ